MLPCVAWPGFVARLARSWDRIGAPEMLAGLGIPAVDEPADAELAAGDPGDHYAVGNQRRHRHRIPVLKIYCVLPPQLLSSLRVKRDHIGVERRTKDLAVIN